MCSTGEELRANTHSTCIISIVRLFTLRSAIDTVDPTWDNVPTSYWTVVELNCGILCACLPTLRPLLRKLFPMADPSEPRSGKGTLSTIGEKYARPRVQGPYTLAMETKAGGSEEELRGEYREGEYARHAGRMSRLTTAVYGGRGRDGGEAGITVTREVGMRESVRV